MAFYSLDKIREELLNGQNVVVIIDNLNGHRFEWMRVFAARCNSIGRQCIFLHLSGSEDYIVEVSVDDSRLVICNEFDHRREVLDLIDSIQVKNWYFCWDADNWLREIAFAKQRISSLVMRPYLGSLRLTSVFRFVIKFVFVGFQILVRRMPVYLLRIPMHESRYLSHHWVDDPNFDLVEFDVDLEEQRRNENEEKRKKIIMVPGFISMRKNPVLAIEICRAVRASMGESIQLSFTGKVEDDVLQILAEYGLDWVVVNNKYLSRTDYLNELRASDLVLLIYENIGSSGVVIDCLGYGVPVLLLENRFWKSLEKESKGLVKLGKKSVERLALEIELILTTDKVYKFRFDKQLPYKNATGFDKMFGEIEG